MVLPDVNVLVYAHRSDAPGHARCHAWLERVVADDTAFGMSDLVLSGFLRVVTHPKVFQHPSPLSAALEFVQQLRDRSNCVPLNPGPRHWGISTRLCRRYRQQGQFDRRRLSRCYRGRTRSRVDHHRPRLRALPRPEVAGTHAVIQGWRLRAGQLRYDPRADRVGGAGRLQTGGSTTRPTCCPARAGARTAGSPGRDKWSRGRASCRRR